LFSYDLPQMARARVGPRSSPVRLDRTNLGLLGKLAKTALPAGIVMMLISLTTNIPRLAVEKFLGKYELGIFAAIMSIIAIGRIVMNALGQAATPRMARLMAAGDLLKFRSAFRLLLLVGIGLGIAAPIGAYLIGEEIVVLIYGPAYHNIRNVLTWCMFAGGVSYLAMFVGYAITAARIFVAQLHVIMVVCLVGVVSSWLLVPVAGLTGAAWSFALAMGVQAIGFFFLLRSKLAQMRVAANPP